MTRTLIVMAGYLALVLGAASYLQQPPAPTLVKLVPVTEAQIKEGVKHDRQVKLRAKRINAAIAAARMVYRANGCRDTYSDLTGRTAYEFGLSPRLLAAVVFVESGCRASVVSGRDSVGIMQVNYHVWKQHSKKEYLNPEICMYVGAGILTSYIRRYGLVEGLHHFNGYSEVHEHTYVNKVLTIAGMIR